MNILQLVMQFFGPVIMNKIAGSLGINSTLAQRAIAAAAPAILAAIVGKAGQPGGAKAIADIIAKLDPNLLGKLGETIGTGKQAGVVEQGASALGSILGANGIGSLAGALSKQAGLGVGTSNTLLGLMTPAILGTIGREQKAANLDAAGLANMLQGQKSKIADAVPADFAKLLSGTGILDAVTGKGPAPAASASATTPATSTSTTAAKPQPGTTAPKPATPASAPKPATSPVKPATSGMKPGMGVPAHQHHHFSWTPWIIAILAAAAIWYWLFGEKAMRLQTTENIPPVVSPSTTLATAQPLPQTLAQTDVGKLLVEVLDNTKGAVAGVRDAASAQAALPRLQDVSGRFDKLSAEVGKLSPDQKRALGTFVSSQLGGLKAIVNSALELPGVSAVLKPILDQLLNRLDALSKSA